MKKKNIRRDIIIALETAKKNEFLDLVWFGLENI